MRETNITRRRVLQGAGAIGVASVGSTVVTAQEGDGGDAQGAAIRVAHASPDAPNVDIRLNSMGDGTAGGGNQTGGVGNETGGAGGNQTNETGGAQGGEDDGGPEIGGLGFREVSSYNEVEPGTYQMEIVPAEGGLLEGFIEDLFGGGDEDERTVLFDGEVDVEEGTTYTVVAFGEVARGPIPAEEAEMDGNVTAGNETGDGMAGNETDGVGQNETGGAGNETVGNETAGNETDGVGGADTTGQGEQLVEELAFGEAETVELDAGDYTLEIRETGAVGMDAETGDGMAGNETVGNETGNETGAAGNETDGTDEENATGEDVSAQEGGPAGGFQVKVLEDDLTAPGEGSSRLRLFHAVPDVDAVSISAMSEDEANGQGGVGNETGGVGNETDGVGGDGGAGQQMEVGVRQAEVSLADNTVYSGFAMGYFDPQAAATAGEGGDGNVTNGNATGDGLAGNETGGVGNETGDGNATGNQSGEDVAEDAQGEEFELVTVEDAQGGERSDGGTGGGLLSVAPPAER